MADLTFAQFSRVARSRGYTVKQLAELIRPWYEPVGLFGDIGYTEFAERLLCPPHKASLPYGKAVIPYRPLRDLYSRWKRKSRKRDWEDAPTCHDFTSYCACHGHRHAVCAPETLDSSGSETRKMPMSLLP